MSTGVSARHHIGIITSQQDIILAELQVSKTSYWQNYKSARHHITKSFQHFERL